MSTTTWASALAVPENVGTVLLDGEEGWFNVTLGGKVSTVKLYGEVRLSPPMPSSSCCATAVYFPSGSGVVAVTLQIPELAEGKPVGDCTGVPVAASPS